MGHHIELAVDILRKNPSLANRSGFLLPCSTQPERLLPKTEKSTCQDERHSFEIRILFDIYIHTYIYICVNGEIMDI
jgi:hypothetical protein